MVSQEGEIKCQKHIHVLKLIFLLSKYFSADEFSGNSFD